MRLSDLEERLWLREVMARGDARRLRIDCDLTLADIAGACGVTSTAVHHWEMGRRTPRGPAALRYARILRILAAQSTEATR